jgi:hypothetical protein
MEAPFTGAIEHIRIMEGRIRQQEVAIGYLKTAGLDTSAAVRRLNLLHSALEEMRIQLAQLTPTEEQMAAPAWALPLGMFRYSKREECQAPDTRLTNGPS